MDWFYAEKDVRKGPASEAEIASLIASREIGPDTLVWNRTMTNWAAASTTELFTAIQSPPPLAAPPGQHLCIITGRYFPETQMLKTEHGWVSAEGKSTYYQSIREGAPIPVADGLSNARSDGNKIVIPVFGGKLPQRCVKTNQPVADDRVRQRKLYWCNSAVYFALLINVLVVIILYYVLRKKVVVDVPLSREGQGIVRKHKLITAAAVIAGFFALIWGVVEVSNQSSGGIVILLGVISMIGGLIYGSFKASLLRVVKIRGGYAWLAGADQEYVATLPMHS